MKSFTLNFTRRCYFYFYFFHSHFCIFFVSIDDFSRKCFYSAFTFFGRILLRELFASINEMNLIECFWVEVNVLLVFSKKCGHRARKFRWGNSWLVLLLSRSKEFNVWLVLWNLILRWNFENVRAVGFFVNFLVWSIRLFNYLKLISGQIFMSPQNLSRWLINLEKNY
jgi:hypothetical protein